MQITVYTDPLKPGTCQMGVFTVGDDQNFSLQFNNGTSFYNPTGVRMDIGFIKGLSNQTFASAFQLVDRLNNRHTGSFVMAGGVPTTMTWDETPIAVYGDNGAWLVKGRTPPSSTIRKVYVNYGGSGLSTAPAIRFQGGATQTGFGAEATATFGAGGIIANVNPTATGYNYSIVPEVIITGNGTITAVRQAVLTGNMVTSYTAMVNGSNYSTATVTVRDPEASATATVGGTSVVTGLTLTAGGSGYTSAPTVVFNPASTTAATAALANSTWGLSGLTITDASSGYTSVPTISFSGGTGSGATAIATIGALQTIVGITLINGGQYVCLNGSQGTVTVTISGGGGTGATANAGLNLVSLIGPIYTVSGVTIANPGSGYTSTPTVTFTNSGWGYVQTASATAIVGAGEITSITLTNPGSGYGAVAPTVNFSSGAATATAQLVGSPVATLTLTDAGSGYTAAPTVTFTGGAGTGAAATAEVSLGITAVTMRQGGYAYTSLPSVHTIPNCNASFECAGVESHSVPFLQNFNPSTAQGAITATPFTSGRRDSSGNLVYDDALVVVRPRYLVQPTLTLQADALTWAGVFTPVTTFVNALLNYRRCAVADVEIWGEGRLLYVGSLTILKA